MPIVVLGGDGTCRDVAIGAPRAVIIPISTGTNNVFPAFIDGSSAGTAAGLLARGALDPARRRPAGQGACTSTSRDGDGSTWHDIALVDLALIDGTGVGATGGGPGVSGEARDRGDRVGDEHRPVGHCRAACTRSTVTIRAPSWFAPDRTVARSACRSCRGPTRTCRCSRSTSSPTADAVRFDGPGVLAFDGERERVIGPDAVVTVTVRTDGPLVIDVARALQCAVQRRLFDVPTVFDVPAGEAHHGD